MIPRLYINTPLAENMAAPLSADQGHYLKNVLRREVGGDILLFNGRDGEFAAKIVELKKKGGVAQIASKTREQEIEPDLDLYIAPVKRGPLETIVQKAVELGVRRVTPVITERTVAARINVDRLQAIATEAAEQCGRMSVPPIEGAVKFHGLLESWTADRQLMFCDEAGDDAAAPWGGDKGRAAPALAALNEADKKTDKWAILIGPEGGFSPEEREALRAKPFVNPVTLGPRILRADTAAIAALSLWQAACGDWR